MLFDPISFHICSVCEFLLARFLTCLWKTASDFCERFRRHGQPHSHICTAVYCILKVNETSASAPWLVKNFNDTHIVIKYALKVRGICRGTFAVGKYAQVNKSFSVTCYGPKYKNKLVKTLFID